MLEKTLTIIAVIALSIVVGIISYNEIYSTNIVVLVDVKENSDIFSTIKHLVPQDSSIKEVKQISKKKYEITICTKRKKQYIIDWIRTNAQVENVTPKSSSF